MIVLKCKSLLQLIVNFMNYKIVSSVTQLTRRAIYTFSKNPFDKFNRKKSGVQPSKGKQPQHQSHPQKQKKTFSRLQKLNQHKLNSKSSNNRHEKVKQSSNSKQPDINSRPKSKQYQIKQPENSKKQTLNQPGKNQISSQSFKRFSRPKIQRQQDNHKQNLNQQKSTNEVKNEEKKENLKEKQIPKITLEKNQEDQDLKSTPILRKPKIVTKTRNPKQQNQPNSQKLPEQNSQQKNKEQQQQQKKKAQMYLSQQSKQLWSQFEQKIEEYKLQKLKLLMRFQRIDLVKKKPEEKQEESNQTSNQQQIFKRKDFKSFYKISILGGVILYLWSSNFDVISGKEVAPQYLKQALQQNKIDQTWISNNEIKNKDDLIRGKNIHQYIFIKQNNGDVYFCLSNQEFSKIWIDSIVKQNIQIDAKISDFFQNKPGQPGAKVQSTPKKIIIKETRVHKNSNLISDIRSYVSLIYLYFIIRSFQKAGRGNKTKTKGDLKDLFKNQKSHLVRNAINVTFRDVVGMQKAKEEIVQFIDFLKFPQKYNKLGARIPRGALLTGPPGTGKTMIAKACAGESKVPFFTISGSQFIEMYVGVGAQRVRDLFKQAKQAAPSIIFIDQIDAVGKKRSSGGYGGGNDQRDTTLNQLLVEMDGFDTNTNVIVFAATNQRQVLDPALTRPGRFDRLIEIDLPDLQGRKEIFEVHLKPIMLEKGIIISDYAKRLATLTPGFSGAEIKNVCNQAAIIAARSNKDHVSIIDFQLATERIIGGVEKKSQLITQQTRRTVAYHECGHGVVSWFIKNANPLLKLTIIPRSKGALGFAQYLPNQNQIYTKIKLMDQICVILGGRIAEQIFFGKISTGASDDLNKAYQIAKTLVTQYGFGNKIGWVQYQETQYAKEYSKDTENKIDTQILQVMKQCTQRTRKLIIQKKDLLKNLAQRLLQQQTIDQAVIQQVLGTRPFPTSKQFQDYITEKKRISQQMKNQQSQVSSSKQVQENSNKSKKIDYLL